ncbi:MAG: hypothetical protein CMJ25_22635 [Phycisphaerae bacterium]|nr:hypothetical protein [Phycisphaerae bacterium]
MTDSAKLPALAVTDRWMRGVYYSRQVQLLEADGTPIDLTAATGESPFFISLSGSSGIKAADSLLFVRLVAGQGANGKLTIGANSSALELDWPNAGLGPRNQVLISVYGRFSGKQRPLLQMRLVVEDSAFA